MCSNINCCDCNYFDRVTKFCRKNPPIAVECQYGIKAKFPVIPRPNEDWCGEAKPRSKTNAQHESVIVKGESMELLNG